MANKIGVIFENNFIKALEECVEYSHSSKNDDKKKGVDFYWFGLPIDITLQELWEKTCCFYLATCDSPIGLIEIGVRIGNVHQDENNVYKEHYFKDNVLVLSFNKICNMSWVYTYDIVRDIVKDVNSDAIIDSFWDLSGKLDELLKK